MFQCMNDSVKRNSKRKSCAIVYDHSPNHKQVTEDLWNKMNRPIVTWQSWDINAWRPYSTSLHTAASPSSLQYTACRIIPWYLPFCVAYSQPLSTTPHNGRHPATTAIMMAVCLAWKTTTSRWWTLDIVTNYCYVMMCWMLNFDRKTFFRNDIFANNAVQKHSFRCFVLQ